MLQEIDLKKVFPLHRFFGFLSMEKFRKKEAFSDVSQVSYTPQEIQEIVEKIVKTRSKVGDVVKDIDLLSPHCNIQKLQSLMQEQSAEFLSIQEAINTFRENADIFLSHFRGDIARDKHVIGFVQSLLVALESFLDSLGLLTFFVPAVSHQEMEEKNRQLTALMSFISMLSATFIPVLGASLGGLFVAGVCLSLLTLTITYSAWKPVPIRLPKFENIKLETLELQHLLSAKRLAIVDKIANALMVCKNSHKQVLLVGPPGSGKTTIIKTLVERIYNNYYSDLKGFSVFYTDSASLLDNRDWVRPPKTGLEKISEMIQGVNHKMIFIFDQIHLLSFFHGKTFAGDQLTSMLDSPNAHFPYVIGSVNWTEYQELKEKTPSFLERFSVIKVDSLDDEDMVQGLQQRYFRSCSQSFVDEGVFDYIVCESKKKWPMPFVYNKMAQLVFSECLLATSDMQKNALEIELDFLQETLQKNRMQKILSEGLFEKKKHVDVNFQKLQQRHEYLQQEVNTLRVEKQKLSEQRELYFMLKMHLYQMTKSKTIQSSENEKLAFFLLGFFVMPALEKQIQDLAEKNNLDVRITKSLVDGIVKKMEV